ncbi:16S rRNA (adenine(1518)-N(6)/adenine(1519)-N(6))-dimethyltransferase RsmA [Corynebacterium vitaeruminis]|uniref:16S rRNA (adenine(1518)-N(6)/adenine(1519)-N(6))- dimethyltransferase RsmA n=1 Tax=Corynebacterium vitaeruminis TaxID=38305 RepID=UPI00065F89D6|nr:16S rRNA (adenine(1518)-N(6)/adenine(1519)-N(6))-dimethyltransferase RsmA [Corynebacterium vitaeruminis]
MTKAEVSFLGPVEVRDLAAQLDIVPTKKLGQNFVHDANTVRRIVAAADLSEDSYPVEVGPGLGSLTLGLLEHCGRAAAVEIDPRLAERLPQTVAERAESCELELIEKDALKVSREDFQTSPDALVANLPYNVSVPVLLHMLAELPTIRRVLVMVQSEVADRLAAQPGSKIYGVPSVKAAYYGTVRRAGAIGPHVFWPAPKVDSGLVRIDCYSRSDGPTTSDAPEAPWEISPQFRARLFPLIDAAFAQRRKTLRAALSGIYGSGAAAEEALVAAGIDPKQRGEKLDIADFVRLAEATRS